MTYKEIVDRFQTVANEHYMIKDFGYGQLSDIKTQSQDLEADYPYMFLNPASHTRNGVIMKYNFNLIMMDIAGDEDSEFSNFLAIQSKCTQYIDDVIAEMYYGFTDKPEINMSNITYTPFKERFQDAVAGVTAVITIDVPTPINRCTAPFPSALPPVPNYDALTYSTTSTRTLANTNAAFIFQTEVEDPNWFLNAAFSNWLCPRTETFSAQISFEGTMTYKVGFDPTKWQLAIYNRDQDLFFGMVDLPAVGGTVSITSDVFEYLPALTDPFGNPLAEVQFLTIYEKGTANPIATPPARLTNPFTYNGTFKIKVVN